MLGWGCSPWNALAGKLSGVPTDIPLGSKLAGRALMLFLPNTRCADGVPESRRRTDTKSCSRPPRIEHTRSHTFKIGHIPGRDGQTVHEGRGGNEGVSIGARVRHVKRRAALGDSGVNR
jgi:hypothetical protein